jgi:hypothetical protein
MSERIIEYDRKHPLATLPGMFALVLWSFYAVYVALHYHDVTTSTLLGGIFGLLACLALVFNFVYWRAAVVVASAVYLLLYVVRVVRMTAIPGDLSFLSALAFYYRISWRVTIGAFEEKGWAGGVLHAVLEFAMPVLVVVLIIVTLMSARRKRGFSRIG